MIYLQRVVCGMFADNNNMDSANKQIADAFCQPYGTGIMLNKQNSEWASNAKPPNTL